MSLILPWCGTTTAVTQYSRLKVRLKAPLSDTLNELKGSYVTAM